MAWRLAKSLITLRDEVSDVAPKRSRISDGTIGDPAHADRASRHNPNRYGVVTALDLTHDPAGGMDVHALARRLVKDPHPELEYVISNGQVAKRRNGFRWERYYGSNQHVSHAHFAVGVGPDSDPRPPYDSTTSWNVATPEPSQPDPEEDDMHAGEIIASYIEAYGNPTRQQGKDIRTWIHAIYAKPTKAERDNGILYIRDQLGLK